MSEEPKRWESIQAWIVEEEINDRTYRIFRARVHSPVQGWVGQSIAVETDRLAAHPWLYGRTLDWLVRELGVWDPQ